MGPKKVSPRKVDPKEVGPKTVGPKKVDPKKVGPKTVGKKKLFQTKWTQKKPRIRGPGRRRKRAPKNRAHEESPLEAPADPRTRAAQKLCPKNSAHEESLLEGPRTRGPGTKIRGPRGPATILLDESLRTHGPARARGRGRADGHLGLQALYRTLTTYAVWGKLKHGFVHL